MRHNRHIVTPTRVPLGDGGTELRKNIIVHAN